MFFRRTQRNFGFFIFGVVFVCVAHWQPLLNGQRPEMVKWVNNHKYDGARLSPGQKELREFYSRLINLVGEPAFASGGFFGLNPANTRNPDFGRLKGEGASGHWLYAFLRYDAKSGQRILAVVNLNRSENLCCRAIITPDCCISAFTGMSNDRCTDRQGEKFF